MAGDMYAPLNPFLESIGDKMKITINDSEVLVWNLSSTAFDWLKQNAASHGFPITEDKGTATAAGCIIDYSYDVDKQILGVNVRKKPMLLPMGLVTGKIAAALQIALNTVH